MPSVAPTITKNKATISMKYEPKSDNGHSRGKGSNLLRTLAIMIICLLLDFLFIITVALLSAGIADSLYNMNHLIVSPVERGKDIGAGLVVIYWAGLSLLFSIPFALATFKKLFAFIFKIWSNK